MTDNTKKAIEQMTVITKIVNADIGDLDKYYILKWFIGGWRDEAWVESEIEFRKQVPIKEIKD